MFDALERRYLLKLAFDCHRKGLSAAETRKIMRRNIGHFTGDNRLTCAIRHVFKN
ncbi:hypothetical protein GCM10007385_06580 [Tateyamaria omphalii]|uniref:hypothetical protein n=1 Tax=Tateyamaria omphalii TaxID=299262 RepID=UPI00167B1FCC|nr:hypothetical protein [Tateyamaria omphalii]GGX41702.1 hypothetical protein GCM10007385_06580 [Tateyamaria omphalii]